MPFEVFQGKFIKTFSGAIEEKGKKLILRMTDKSDLARDILTVNVFTDFLFYMFYYIYRICVIFILKERTAMKLIYVVFIKKISNLFDFNFFCDVYQVVNDNLER